MSTELRRWSTWVVIGVTALLAAGLTLALERGLAALQSPTPTPTPGPLQPIVVQLPTPAPQPLPTAAPPEALWQQVRQLEQQLADQRAATAVFKAVWQISFAMEALQINDLARADGELVAVKLSLDQAFALMPEDFKPQLDTERQGISRIRADLLVNPRGLDEELSQMRDRLLSLVTNQQP
ncbi:hypothetical protein [Kallotenue papyrolyticum]|uniref:hypothetical protein n=1 Tax=Kallotenue papyrolyticum TaxID=1325125 RepID=UPI00049294D0|nr:hypothetical protein [Kallotenue papyrolyticum]